MNSGSTGDRLPDAHSKEAPLRLVMPMLVKGGRNFIGNPISSNLEEYGIAGEEFHSRSSTVSREAGTRRPEAQGEKVRINLGDGTIKPSSYGLRDG